MRVEVEGEQLRTAEIVAMCNLLLIAGNVTTTDLIGNGVRALMRHPEQLEKLRARPELVPNAVEEMLRYDSPVVNSARIAPYDFELDGVQIEKGDSIVTVLGAANRDPRQYDRPDTLDLSRKPNRHLAFAQGPHLCAGFSLARMEGRIAIARFLKRFPGYRLDGEARRTGRVRFRGFSTLPAKVN